MEDFGILINKKIIEFEKQIKDHLKSMSIKSLTLLGINIVNIDKEEILKIMEILFSVEQEFNEKLSNKISIEEPLEKLINNMILYVEKKKALEIVKQCIAIESILQLMALQNQAEEQKTFIKE